MLGENCFLRRLGKRARVICTERTDDMVVEEVGSGCELQVVVMVVIVSRGIVIVSDIR
jgi:hypothetical protein